MATQDDNRLRLQQAMARHQSGDIAGAMAEYRQLLPLMPDDADLLFLIGTVALQWGRFAESTGWFETLLAQCPDHAQGLGNLAIAYREQGRFDEALVLVERGLAVWPKRVALHLNHGQLLHRMHRYADALAAFERAGALADSAEAHNGRGAALRDLMRFEDALAAYDQALALRPDYIEALSNRGNVLKMLRRLDEAMDDFDRALALRPGYVSAMWNKALLALLRGDYATGWPLYEARLQRFKTRTWPQPRWCGEDLHGKRILLHAEQGLGDAVQFIRYVPQVQARGGAVIIEAPPQLLPLFDSLAGDVTLVARGEALPVFDCHCPLMSLPLVFGTTLTNMPSATPYLHADAGKCAQWRAKLGGKTRPRIGLVWAGKGSYRDNARRSLSPDMLKPVLDMPFDFHALQKEIAPEDAATLAGHANLALHDDALLDFSDTAALIAEMDLVLSVDTAVAHVAGALGRPVWLLLPFVPDWRWLLDRDVSPWYPSARLFRQPHHGDWDAVIADVARALAKRDLHIR